MLLILNFILEKPCAQVEQMHNSGLIKGGSLDNAIVCRHMLHFCMHYNGFLNWTGSGHYSK